VGEIRSAWEIAQEKAGKLGDLSPEERQRQREDKYRLIGKSVAEKYLELHDTKYLQSELSKHDSADKEPITHAVIQRLVEEIDLSRGFMLDKITHGILSLTNNRAAESLGKLNELFKEYKEVEERQTQDIEKAGREILHQIRISGTAIGQINIRAKEEWREKISMVTPQFEDRLSELRQELLSSALG
jgi:hypothetical protein